MYKFVIDLFIIQCIDVAMAQLIVITMALLIELKGVHRAKSILAQFINTFMQSFYL